MAESVCVEIRSESDVARAAREGRVLAKRLGFSASEASHVATAVSEVAGNIWLYARAGSVQLAARGRRPETGITAIASDAGPGIADLELAMGDGYSTRGGMGLGLPGARRLMDEFDITSEAGVGTTITMTRWRRDPDAAGRPPPPLVDWGGAGPQAGREVVVAPFRNGVLVALAAGLGAGPEAAAAAARAASVLRERASGSPIELIERCHRELEGGPRVALAVASFSALDARMTWIGLGPVDCALGRADAGAGARFEPAPVHDGAAGGVCPAAPAAATVAILQGDVLVMASPRSGGSEEGLELTGPPGQVAERVVARRSGASFAVAARFSTGIRERRP